MTRLLFPALFCLYMMGCHGRGLRFTVVGDLKNVPPSQTVLLQEIGYDDLIRTIDSTHADDRGHFELSADGRGPALYRLYFDNQNQVLLSLSNESVRLAGDYHQQGKISITGSPSSSSLQRFTGMVDVFVQADQTLSAVQKQLQAQGKDSLMAVAAQDQAGRAEKFSRDVEHYADSTTYLPNALYSVRLLNPSVEGAFLEGFCSNITRRFPNERAAKDFADKYKAYVAGKKGDTGGPIIGVIAPDLSLPAPDGTVIKLSSLRGKYVLLDFWASWCPPCRRENPNVVAAFSKFHDKGFTVYGVSLDEKKEAWTAAIAKDGLTWTHVSDLHGWESVAARDYSISEIPSNFLLDKEGKIIARNLHGSELEAKLADVLK